MSEANEANKEVVRNIEPGMPTTLQTGKMSHGMALSAFPDRKVEIVDLIAEGDRVFVRMRVTGTNKGPAFWFNVPEPTNRPIDFESWGVYRIRDGKVIEHWGSTTGCSP